ncbi:2-phospho-L-lactate guanylyltransferase [Salinibacterium sp. ZJ450]|uniref:2-phospho-L-lactate guanylyltransferase n=1 Tax=Salinibacterium sp. ZJ450 TaxID=2708338 RepID=UPI00141EEFF9|nr:2-phospho-L-lactate guanylyltransferase [Salinibacterium sp. ZJ450]
MSALWSLVLPVKGADGKSRLALADDRLRSPLAIAFALDAIDAVLAAGSVGRVIVVTSDVAVAGALHGSRAEIVPDPGEGLNAAIRSGLAVLELAHPAGVLLADLPALTAHDLDAALAVAATHPLAMVPDADGTGTTLSTALRADALVPRFGAGSRAVHEQAGHVPIELPATSGLRRDVDSEPDLRQALALGVGRHTRAALDPASPASPE